MRTTQPYLGVLGWVGAGQKVGSSVFDDHVEVALVVHTAIGIVLDRRPPPAFRVRGRRLLSGALVLRAAVIRCRLASA